MIWKKTTPVTINIRESSSTYLSNVTNSTSENDSINTDKESNWNTAAINIMQKNAGKRRGQPILWKNIVKIVRMH